MEKLKLPPDRTSKAYMTNSQCENEDSGSIYFDLELEGSDCSYYITRQAMKKAKNKKKSWAKLKGLSVRKSRGNEMF